ncbi:MAG: glucosaminidase domain-containing protein [Bryobacteraceae bacterium]
MREIAKAAVQLEADRGYPPRLLVAQWALESNWGSKPSGANNYFGITFNPARHRSFEFCRTCEEMTDGQIAALAADERATIRAKIPLGAGRFRLELDRKFASYESLDEALGDKTSLIMNSPRYRDAFARFRQDGDVEGLIVRIAAAGYATASLYAQAVLGISRQTNVLNAIEEARHAA